jgi:hypothetical protein
MALFSDRLELLSTIDHIGKTHRPDGLGGTPHHAGEHRVIRTRPEQQRQREHNAANHSGPHHDAAEGLGISLNRRTIICVETDI